MFTFILFRSNNLTQAFDYYHRLFSDTILSPLIITEKVNTIAMLAAFVIMMVAEWFQRDKQHALQIDFIGSFPVRALIYFFLIFAILTFSPTKGADFIYFKF